MFDWLIDFIRWLGWMMYAGMCHFIGDIYDTLMAIPNALGSVLHNDTVDNLFNASRATFLIFAGLMILVIVISRLFDLNISKMMNQLKKVFILFLLLLSMPWIIETSEKLTNAFMQAGTNVMTSEMGSNYEDDLGVSLANVYIYPSADSVGADEEEYYDAGITDIDSPFKTKENINDEEIINLKVKNGEGDEVYAYSYVNPILGILLNLVIIVMLAISLIKLYGYLGKLIVLKVWVPIKMIKTGFDDESVSEPISDLLGGFTSVAIQVIMVPFSMIVATILMQIEGINVVEQIIVFITGLSLIIFGIDYIQTKFMTSSGMEPMQVYGAMMMAKTGGSLVGQAMDKTNELAEKAGDKVADWLKKDSDTDLPTTGRSDDLKDLDTNVDTDKQVDSDTDVDSDTEVASDTDVDSDTEIDSDTEVDSDTEIDSDTDVDSDTEIDSDTEVDSDTDVDSDTEIDSDTEVDSENQLESNIDDTVKTSDVVNDDIDDVVKTSDVANGDIDEDVKTSDVAGDEMDKKMETEKSKEIPDEIKPTVKQMDYAKQFGIDPEGKTRGELGMEIEKASKEKHSQKNKGNYVEPNYDKPVDNNTDYRSKIDSIINGKY